MNSTTTIVEDTAGRLFSVVPAPDGLEHVWIGVPVKRIRGEFVPASGAKAVAVRKAGCRVPGGVVVTTRRALLTPLRRLTQG